MENFHYCFQAKCVYFLKFESLYIGTLDTNGMDLITDQDNYMIISGRQEGSHQRLPMLYTIATYIRFFSMIIMMLT